MDKHKTILVAGGDLRQLYLAKLLSESFTVYVIGFEKNLIPSENIKGIESLMSLECLADFVILPLPASVDGVLVNAPFSRQSVPLDNISAVMKEDGIVFGGKFSSSVKEIFTERGLEAIDYFEREELSVMNAVPTAEGAVQIALEELPTTLFGRKAVIIGFGRITKALIGILKGFGVEVTVAARKCHDLAWAEIMGRKAVHISRSEKALMEADLIFNTVPAKILEEDRLSLLKKSCLLIDLASKPGGVDFDTAGRLGVKTVWALSLPGKVAPVTSGEMIAHTILNILDERRALNG